MEGKYWKRKMNTILAEYKKWRIFYKQQHCGGEGCAGPGRLQGCQAYSAMESNASLSSSLDLACPTTR